MHQCFVCKQTTQESCSGGLSDVLKHAHNSVPSKHKLGIMFSSCIIHNLNWISTNLMTLLFVLHCAWSCIFCSLTRPSACVFNNFVSKLSSIWWIYSFLNSFVKEWAYCWKKKDLQFRKVVALYWTNPGYELQRICVLKIFTAVITVHLIKWRKAFHSFVWYSCVCMHMQQIWSGMKFQHVPKVPIK